MCSRCPEAAQLGPGAHVTAAAVGCVVLCGGRAAQGLRGAAGTRPGCWSQGCGVGRGAAGWAGSPRLPGPGGSGGRATSWGGCSAPSLARDGHCGRGPCLEHFQGLRKAVWLALKGKIIPFYRLCLKSGDRCSSRGALHRDSWQINLQ